jgi:hypothetical protein
MASDPQKKAPQASAEETPPELSGQETEIDLGPGKILLDKYLLLEEVREYDEPQGALEGVIGPTGEPCTLHSAWLAETTGTGERRILEVFNAPSHADDQSFTDFLNNLRNSILARQDPPPISVKGTVVRRKIVRDILRAGRVAYVEIEHLYLGEGNTLEEILSLGRACPLLWVERVLHEICNYLGLASRTRTGLDPEYIFIWTDPTDGPEHVMVADGGAGVNYESPEQLINWNWAQYRKHPPEGFPQFDRPPSVDGRSALYSLGVIVYQMLTGVRPWSRRDTRRSFFKQAPSLPPRFAESAPDVVVPRTVEDLVLQCLEFDPVARPESAFALSHRLRKAIEDVGTSSKIAAPGETDSPKQALSAPGGAPRVWGALPDLCRWLGGLLKKAVSTRAPVGRRDLEPRGPEPDETLGVEDDYGIAYRKAEVSFPSQVLVGEPCRLVVQLIPIVRGRSSGFVRARNLPFAGDWTASLFVSYFASASQSAAPLSEIELTVSVAAENFDVEGTDRAVFVVPLEGDSRLLQFILRGRSVGPARVMIDFLQGGRPAGSVDLAPDVVQEIDPGATSARSARPVGASSVTLLTGKIPSPPDLVIKVFEQRLAGHPGRLQFVLSSTQRALCDLPVFDGDLGTLDLRTDVAGWVDDQLRTAGELARHPEVSTEEVQRSLTRVGSNLYQQLLPPALQNLCWTLERRGVKTMMILSDEPYIPWELIKPFQLNPATGGIVEEYPFWGEAFAVTHWLRGRPPAPRLSIRRVVAVGAGSPWSNSQGEQASGTGKSAPLSCVESSAEGVRDMTLTNDASSGASEPHSSEAVLGSAAAEETPSCALHSETALGTLESVKEELELIRSLESLGSTVVRLPAKRKALQDTFERGDFDLLHLASHSTFGGARAGDASAVLLEDGEFTAAQLSPLMAGPLRRAQPLVFFNACHSGRLGLCPTRLGSWGSRFVELGCGGFVGALWPVTDRAAVAFARSFYELIAQRRPIGEAVRLSRHRVRQLFPNDPTWLSYRCFADPMARVRAPLVIPPVSRFHPSAPLSSGPAHV